MARLHIARPDTFRGWLVGIAVVGLLVRLAYVVVFDRYRYPDIAHDSTWYYLSGVNIARGRGYIDPNAWFGVKHLALATVRSAAHPPRVRMPTAQTPPLFPALLGLVALVAGDSYYAQQVALCLLGTVTVVLVGLLGREIAGDLVGLVAAALAAVYPMLFQSEVGVMSEALYALLVVAALLLTLRFKKRPSALNAAALGVAIGLAAITRSEGILFLVLLAFPVTLGLRDVAIKRRASLLVLVTAIGIAGYVGWSIRSSIVLHGTVLLSDEDGNYLAGANCTRTYRGPGRGTWDYQCLRANRHSFRHSNEVRENHVLREQALRYIRHHLSEVPGVAVIRVLRTWGVYDPIGEARWEGGENRALPTEVLGWLMYIAFLPAAVLGFALLRRRHATIWPLVSTVVLVTVVSVVGYGNPRFRIPAEPALLVAAATAIVAITRRGRTHGGGFLAAGDRAWDVANPPRT